uniref:NIF system FeS cluster assembly NifU C-terminal domain-containing protein n=1 Tax=Helicotheca tamesis TaxID=374047 RepID=A0A7S2IGB4_9STRA|eukprot:CAMPEP_0185731582 /NCGR_PEP_ID=MMETSP1171-20130828/13418_1 /TAXON_ID=374046 /ORGANISM="Helicotheca tamensis, Strain CCMP826" /LENGTH=456 /DNA_ID=CAMNT_0028400883 /DNA_START=8 /DNA_END=1378 /DNA_ORIENTATION=+
MKTTTVQPSSLRISAVITMCLYFMNSFSLCSAATTIAFVSTPTASVPSQKIKPASSIATRTSLGVAAGETEEGGNKGPSPPLQNAPTLNGKMVLPLKVMMSGLKSDNKVAAVYAVINNQYKRGGDGWEQCEYVGVTRNLSNALQSHLSVHGSSIVANVRALTFAYPQRAAMEDVASIWRGTAAQAGGNAAVVAASGDEISAWKVSAATETSEEEAAIPKDMEDVITAAFDDNDDDEDYDDDDEFDDFMMEQALAMENARSAFADARGDVKEEKREEVVISPFSAAGAAAGAEKGEVAPLVFSLESVDKILDAVRPYLISDGGNVSVDRVDEETKNVYLILEGACGSCASSTVTMQMGIERVLKESFPDLGEVIQVDNLEGAGGEDANSTELTYRAVEEELSRIKPAILAMGGIVEIVSVDPLGVVELKYRGSNKVQQGLELAIRDVPYVKHVKFVS